MGQGKGSTLVHVLVVVLSLVAFGFSIAAERRRSTMAPKPSFGTSQNAVRGALSSSPVVRESQRRRSENFPSIPVRDWPFKLTEKRMFAVRKQCHIQPEVLTRLFREGERIDQAPEDYLPLSTNHILAGLRFPLHPFIVEVCKFFYCSPGQFMPNAWRFIVGFVLVCTQVQAKPTIGLLMRIMSPKLTGVDHDIVQMKQKITVFDDVPTSNKGWHVSFMLIENEDGEDWGFDVHWRAPKNRQNYSPQLTNEEVADLKKITQRVFKIGDLCEAALVKGSISSAHLDDSEKEFRLESLFTTYEDYFKKDDRLSPESTEATESEDEPPPAKKRRNDIAEEPECIQQSPRQGEGTGIHSERRSGQGNVHSSTQTLIHEYLKRWNGIKLETVTETPVAAKEKDKVMATDEGIPATGEEPLGEGSFFFDLDECPSPTAEDLAGGLNLDTSFLPKGFIKESFAADFGPFSQLDPTDQTLRDESHPKRGKSAAFPSKPSIRATKPETDTGILIHMSENSEKPLMNAELTEVIEKSLPSDSKALTTKRTTRENIIFAYGHAIEIAYQLQQILLTSDHTEEQVLQVNARIRELEGHIKIRDEKIVKLQLKLEEVLKRQTKHEQLEIERNDLLKSMIEEKEKNMDLAGQLDSAHAEIENLKGKIASTRESAIKEFQASDSFKEIVSKAIVDQGASEAWKKEIGKIAFHSTVQGFERYRLGVRSLHPDSGADKLEFRPIMKAYYEKHGIK